MKFKRLTAVIAAAVMVFSLAACGGDASGGQTGEQTAGTQQSEVKEESDAVQETTGGESVEIRFMWWGGILPEMKFIIRSVTALNWKTPGLR